MNTPSKPEQLAQGGSNETSVSQEQVNEALARLADFLLKHDTDSTEQLKRFVWSLWNGDHHVNLYRLGCVLDANKSESVAVIFLAYMRGMLTEGHFKWILDKSGEDGSL